MIVAWAVSHIFPPRKMSRGKIPPRKSMLSRYRHLCCSQSLAEISVPLFRRLFDIYVNLLCIYKLITKLCHCHSSKSTKFHKYSDKDKSHKVIFALRNFCPHFSIGFFTTKRAKTVHFSDSSYTYNDSYLVI